MSDNLNGELEIRSGNDWRAAGAASDGKADNGKIRMSLLMTQFGEILEEVAGVLTFGAEKYPKPPLDDSWRDVPLGEHRYKDALYRHLTDTFVRGEKLDKESNRHHIAHAICNLLFLYGLEKSNENTASIISQLQTTLINKE